MGSCRILHDAHMYHHSFKLSFRYQNHTLISHNFFIRTYQLLLTCFQLPRSLVQNLQPSKLPGHFEFKILRSPTVVRLQSAAVNQEIYPYSMPEALAFFCHRFEREESRKFCFPQILLVPQANSLSIQQRASSSA
jgi:hypothetical protein